MHGNVLMAVEADRRTDATSKPICEAVSSLRDEKVVLSPAP
jgi:hypothetical protein